MSHMVYPDGVLKFEVKWEGYDKKTDRTWESKENLLENAGDILRDYLEAHGGEDKILEDSEKGIKGKKRGRPAASGAAAGKRRKADHPRDGTPPASTKAWKPPAGSWEDEVDTIDACHDENSGKLIVYLTWKNGQKTQHETKVIYQRCPQKMLKFYERHVKIVQ
ncbi:chromo domain-like protein [Microdochium bolleyi]|uniref:Chromo domain-like protein n=1 Tax=Microdochium bolleyi TaxID=196109 RepID=A0A136IXQ5_9PEZI|nr:chromo domain-like protein [Microdochium bolleyi]